MSDRERLIELLTDNLPRCGNLPHWDNPLQLSCDEQVERIADHLIANGVTVQDGKDANVPTKWISVNDRLPEFGEKVIVCDVDEDYVSAWEYRRNWYGDGISWDKDSVTHWMPLAQPPKVE